MEPLDSAIERFPELGEAIEQRFRIDADFREACQDYAEVRRALTLLRSSAESLPTSPDADYETLLQELETEIYLTLQRQPAGGT